MTRFVFLFVLITWEVFYFAGLIDPGRYYHPLGAIEVLTDVSFLRGFGMLLLQVVAASVVGAAIAAAVAKLILRYSTLVGSTVCFLRIAMWVPFIMYWPLPIWSPWTVNFLQTFAMTLLVIVSAVILGGVRNYLITRLVPDLTEADARWWLLRTAILQALFISIFSQLWLGPYGWHWYDFRVRGAYAASMLILLFVFFVERSLRTHFDYVSAIRGKILVREFDLCTVGTGFGSLLITLLLIAIWQVLSLFPLARIISSPLTVLDICYHLLFQGTFWQHAYMSVSAMFGGLVLSTGATLILYRTLYIYKHAQHEFFVLLPLLHITFFFSPIILMEWFGNVGYLQKALGIGMVTIYPLLEALWGLRDRVLGVRLVLAIDAALPYAVVMMLFSEAMASRGGLGFSMVMAHAEINTVPEGIAVGLITIALFVIFTSTLTLLAKLGACFPRTTR